MEEAKSLCKDIFEPRTEIWHEDWKMWCGLVGYCGIWAKWLLWGLDWRFETKLLQCFSLDLLNLHLLQFTKHGITFMFCMVLLQSFITTYAVWVPLKTVSHITSFSTYTRISGSLWQASWIFMGQMLFAWFYLYSLSCSYSDIDNAEYLFWFAGFVSVQMTMFFARGHDSHLGHTWNAGQALYVLRNVEDLTFVKEGDSADRWFTISYVNWLLRCFYGFAVNLILRDFIGYSVPVLLMHFHQPINCVIYSVAVNFIVTLDDSDELKYKVDWHRHSRSVQRHDLVPTQEPSSDALHTEPP